MPTGNPRHCLAGLIPAAPRSPLRFGGGVPGLRYQHRDVEAAGGPTCWRSLWPAWTLGVSRQRWALARLVPLAVTVAVATGLLSLLFSWHYQPLFTDGNSIPLEPGLFGLRGVAYAAWTLAAFSIGALAGLLIRRVVPAMAVTLAASVGLTFATGLYLRQHYIAPLLGRNLSSPPASAWVLGGWWTKGGAKVSQSRINQLMDTLFQQAMNATVPKNVKGNDIKFYKGPAQTQALNYLTHHGYTQWISYQPGSRF